MTEGTLPTEMSEGVSCYRFAPHDERTHELSVRGVQARRIRAAGLKELADLPELTDVASAKEILARLVDLGVADQIAGSRLLATVRAVEVFLRAISDEQNRAELAEARELLRGLKHQAAFARPRVS